jgi:hypothetical protein
LILLERSTGELEVSDEMPVVHPEPTVDLFAADLLDHSTIDV